ncbi:MAG: PaRep2b protein [Pyrobaculum sp.]|nr:PaRep2b protein [Pyrobaculum sp.]
MLREGWPKYEVGLSGGGALVVRYETANPHSIEREAQRFRAMGLEEGKHFTVKVPKDGEEGYVSILRKGLERAAWLSKHGTEGQRELAAEFVKYILQRAWEAGEKVYEKATKIIEEGMSRGSLKLKGLEKEVEVNGRRYVVKVIGGEAVEEEQNGKTLLRIRITAEIDGIRGKYEVTYGRYGKLNATLGFAVPRADAPGGREEDAKRLAALIKALTGKEPRIHKSSNGKIDVACGREHLEGFRHYAELADVIEKWLEETSRR